MSSEMIALRIIASAGDGKAKAFDALEEAKKGNFEAANQLIEESDNVSVDAHQAQTDLLVSFANGEATDMDVLLVHAQDHLMTGILAQELIREMIKMYQKIDELEKQLGGMKK